MTGLVVMNKKNMKEELWPNVMYPSRYLVEGNEDNEHQDSQPIFNKLPLRQKSQ
jgi:hypothetical protein